MDSIPRMLVTGEPIQEYFCKDCEQLRLCLDSKRTTCGNCNSSNLVWGLPGELDKQKLIKEQNEQIQ